MSAAVATGPDELRGTEGAPDWTPYADFGPMVASVDVDDAVVAGLRTWLPTYLRAVKEKKGLDYDLEVPRPSNYSNTIEDAEWKNERLPAVLVATAKIQGQPVRDGDGVYAAGWLTIVSCVVRSPNRAQTRRLASYYELAVRLAMTQNLPSDPENVVSGVRWIDGGEVRPLMAPGKNRFLGEGASQFWVFTDDVVDDQLGPRIPDAFPYDAFPTVQSVTFNDEQVDP